MLRLNRLPGARYYYEYRLSMAFLSFRADDSTPIFGVVPKLLHVTLHLGAQRCCAQFGLSIVATKSCVLIGHFKCTQHVHSF
jgi:hypothetical protein